MYTDERLKIVDKAIDVLKMYGQITSKQITNLFKVSENEGISILNSIIRKGMGIQIKENEKIVVKSSRVRQYDTHLEYALDLLLELIKNNEEIDFFMSEPTDNEPSLLFFQTSDDIIDIAYIPDGKEKMYNNKWTRLDYPNTYLVIIENKQQMKELTYKGIEAFYLVTKEGVVYVEED